MKIVLESNACNDSIWMQHTFAAIAAKKSIWMQNGFFFRRIQQKSFTKALWKSQAQTHPIFLTFVSVI